MALNHKQFDLIQHYLGNQISEEDKVMFQENLENAEFREELLLQSQLIDALDIAQDIALKKQLSLYQPNKLKISKTSFLKEPLLKYAAIFVILIGAIFLFNQNKETDYISLINDHNSLYPAEVVQRGESIEMTSEYRTAMSLYANGAFNEALKAFELLSQQSDKSLLYQSNALLAIGAYEKAKVLLVQITHSSDKSIAENAQWYLGMAQLGTKNVNEAKATLKLISESKDHLFSGKAKVLLSKLN